MSIGHCAYADLIGADASMLLYSYCCYTLNEGERTNDSRDEDGELYIDRVCLTEPEIHEKIKRMPSGRKKRIVKRIVCWDYDLSERISTGKIQIKNASGTWRTDENGTDIMAVSLLNKLFITYQKTGEVPAHIGFYK